MCEAHVLPWEDFKRLFARVAEIGNVTVDSPRSTWGELDFVDDIQTKRYQHVSSSAAQRMVDLCGGNSPTSLWLLLQLTSRLQCYDRRDKVYGLLSMAKSGAEGIDADYELPLCQLMHCVLSNSYADSSSQSVHDVNARCVRLKATMGLGPDFPWGAEEYFAAEELTQASNGTI